MKKETLEEAATIEGLYRCSQHNFNQAEAGYNAKWFKRGALFGAKWQQERMYSEEEVLEVIRQYALEEHLITSSKPDIWFEQFKNK
jgi:hypothetical protein